MFFDVNVNTVQNEVTGFGIHATNFFRMLEKVGKKRKFAKREGRCNITLLDIVSASHATTRLPYPSILYTVWESTEYPAEFMDKLKLYDQLWVPSLWQKACNINQGIPEEFIKVVPEGVDPDIFKPISAASFDQFDFPSSGTFDFLMVGKWEPRKSNIEICQAFIDAFPVSEYQNVRLYLSCDTLFPCDQYKSTEERLIGYGINDPRIIPVHFEDKSQYVRRLQNANVFVSCSRAEGWGLPIIEAMACGIPTIVADWSGSMEYSNSSLKVNVNELKPVKGIYGNWECPGEWGEPDYDHLRHVMKESYKHYQHYKNEALADSIRIRTEFSWEAAANKALDILDELSYVPDRNAKLMTEPIIEVVSEAIIPKTSFTSPEVMTPEALKSIANRLGFKAVPHKAIFVLDSWPNNQGKIDALAESIEQIHSFGFPVIVSTHFPLPPEISELAEFVIYEKQDILSGNDKAIYWRKFQDGRIEEKQCNIEYHGVAAINCLRNAIDFCRGKYDWIYQMSADMEVDLGQWIDRVQASNKEIVCIPYEGVANGIGGGLWAARTEVYDKVVPYLTSWKQYADMYPDVRFVAERWLYNYVSSKIPAESIDWIYDVPTRNRWDQVDRNVWPEIRPEIVNQDKFSCNFLDGATFKADGSSDKDYDVTFENSIDGLNYNVTIKPGMYAASAKKFYREWKVTAKHKGETVFEHILDLKGRRVLISMGSKAIGDTIAWIPYVEEFRKKHDCHVILSTWWNHIFDYPEIEFVEPATLHDEIYAAYNIGCSDDQPNCNPVNWRIIPLQKVSADILGIDYVPLRAKLKVGERWSDAPALLEKYICFSEFSTMRNKFWNHPGGWQQLINYLVSLGYSCVSISPEQTSIPESNMVIHHNGQRIEDTIADIAGAKFYVGLNHGPSWIAYALGIPYIMITGVSESWNDAPNDYRVSIDVCRPGCFNDPDLPIDRGFDWCPRKKDYACTKEITPDMVMKMVDKLENDLLREEVSDACNYKETARRKIFEQHPGWREGEKDDIAECEATEAAS